MTFHELALYFQRLEETASRNTMTEILAELFTKASADEIDKICYLLQGRVAPLFEPLEFGMADKFVIRAIALACDVSNDEVVRMFQKMGDLGNVAENAKSQMSNAKSKGSNVSVETVFNRLRLIAEMGGAGSQEKKIGMFVDLLRDVDPLSARFLARIPIRKLRLGFSGMTMLDALSWMLGGDKTRKDVLEAAYNVRADLGYIAKTVKEKGVRGISHVKAKVGTPILASLCQRLPTADEMIKKMGESAVEPKYDGERVQIHFSKMPNAKWQMLNGKVRTFSRNLEDTTEMFPELGEIGTQLNADSVILDCEAVGLDPKTGKIVDFQTTMTRKRKHDIAETAANVPLRFFVFDILYKDGDDLLAVPLSQRKEILKNTIKTGELLMITDYIIATEAESIRRYHEHELKVGLEGIVVKKWNSPYEPGRRGYSWVKLKEKEGTEGKLTDTIDAVIMGYTYGEGKRTEFGIGQFLVGVRKGDSFVTVTKVGTGVSDDQWRDLKKRLHVLAVKEQPNEYNEVNKLFTPDVWVSPELVVEIAGDDLTKSPSHGAGYAVRFPRLVKIRDDKSPNEATTVKELTEMYRAQGSQTANKRQ